MCTYATHNQITYGNQISPVSRIAIFSPKEWEEFTEEWLDTKSDYIETETLGGANDKGRDVVAYVTDRTQSNYVWDCYQCKHYDNALTPSEIWQEIGKILYYTYKGDYPIPRNYYFVAPKGCGTLLSSYLDKPVIFKRELKNNWVNGCRENITKKECIELENDFKNHVENFDFSIFKKVQIKTLVEEHKKHRNHMVRFGGGLEAREKLTSIPKQLQGHEIRYVEQLLLAYNSVNPDEQFSIIDDLSKNQQLQDHFERARLSFHFAEQLRNLYRDSVPIGTFEDFQNDIYDGVINTAEAIYQNDYYKVKAVESKATSLQITSNPLIGVSVVKDRNGVCHQLVNEGKLTWVSNG